MIELKFHGSPEEVMAEASLFVAQMATGGKMIAAAHAQRQAEINAEKGDGKSGQVPEPMPVAEEVKPFKPKAKKPEAPKPVPVVENVEQTVEDVFDDGPDPAAENQANDIPTPKTLEELKSFIVQAALTPDRGKALLEEHSPTGKLSGVPIENYGAVVKAVLKAAAAQKAARQ